MMDGTTLQELVHFARPYLDRYGYGAVFAFILLENAGLPVPGQTMLIAAAVLAAHGHLNIVPVLLTAWLAAVLGDGIGFTIGRLGGRRLLENYGRYIGITEKRLARVDLFFERYGGLLIVFARFLEVIRQINGIIAGASHMRWRRFLVYNAIGAILWVGAWGLLVYLLGRDFRRIVAALDDNQQYILATVLLLLLLAAFFLYRRGRTRNADHNEPQMPCGNGRAD